MKIDNELLYGPCPCGSGKRFKFCCWPKCRDELDGEFTRAELIAHVRRAAGGEDTAVCNPEAEALCDEGEELWVDGERKQAWQFFTRARTVDPKARVAWIHEAQCAWYEGYVETAHDTMKRGLEACPGRNAWEWALLAVFSHALGREDEAAAWLERVLEEREPSGISEALAVCYALGLFRRHQDLVDYATDSGMDDDGRVALLKATALANLDDFEGARKALKPSLRDKMSSAEILKQILDKGAMPRSFFGGWPYLTGGNFPLAACFEEAVREGRNPFARHREALADIFEVLIAEDLRTPDEILSLLMRWDEEIPDGLRERLKLCAAADLLATEEEDRPPMGIVEARDDRDGSVRLQDCKWRLDYEIGEKDKPEECAAEIADRLVRPYVERYCEFPKEDEKKNRPIVFLDMMKHRGEHDGDAPVAKLGTEKEYWGLLQSALAQIFIDDEDSFYTCEVAFDSMQGGPVVIIENSRGLIETLMVCLLDRPGEQTDDGEGGSGA